MASPLIILIRLRSKRLGSHDIFLPQWKEFCEKQMESTLALHLVFRVREVIYNGLDYA